MRPRDCGLVPARPCLGRGKSHIVEVGSGRECSRGTSHKPWDTTGEWCGSVVSTLLPLNERHVVDIASYRHGRRANDLDLHFYQVSFANSGTAAVEVSIEAIELPDTFLDTCSLPVVPVPSVRRKMQ